MLGLKKEEYDVIIIGAGIGGLVCGCYLAKAGKKVLIVEKNDKPGGYCTSFKRGIFTIDTAVHSIQNCEQENILYRIFHELDIDHKIKLIRGNPTDTVIIQNHRIDIRNNIDDTINNFQIAFPKEAKAIKEFFHLINLKNYVYFYSNYRNKTFKEILDRFFRTKEIKDIFSIFLGNIGSLPNNTSAVTAFILLKQFILSGGYYPKGGMQRIPDSIVEEFYKNGGELLLKERVGKIIIRNDRVCGVELSSRIINSKIVISNSDLTYTTTKLLNLDSRCPHSVAKIANAKPSYSIFIVYLIIRKKLKNHMAISPGIWCVIDRQIIDKEITFGRNTVMIHPGMFISIASMLDDSIIAGDYDVVRIMTSALPNEASFWHKYSEEIARKLIALSKTIIPDLEKIIVHKSIATPLTMRNYTLNRDGAVCGWMNSVEQINDPITKYLPHFKNLFYVGHWVTEKYGNGGVAMAANSGRKVAKAILGDRLYLLERRSGE